MASIYKYKKGYRIQVTINGVRRSATFLTKKECIEWEYSIRKELDNSHIESTAITLEELILHYINKVTNYKKRNKAERNRLLKIIRDYPELVLKPVNQITRYDLAQWRDSRLSTISSGSVLKEFIVLNHIFKKAINEWEYLESNPMDTLERPKASPPRDRIIQDWEIYTLLETLGYAPNKKIITYKDKVAVVFLFALETALRASEMCQLEWRDIWEEGRVLSVKTSKTRTGIREVPISGKAISILNQVKKSTIKCTTVFGINTSQLDSNFRKYRKQAGLSGFTFHDSRATAITRLSKKLDILDLTRMVGHSDPKMLMVYYRKSASDIAAYL
ncbi:tyrosine-type recombinase/integrase [Oligella urethralis]|uniref:tyrosine-type recombinase/integrase n=1 Tax=Oligella urethralis TaxID=90245 RepID=UPI00242FAAC1|nr:site-specific integrase [Oligella urethralis]